MAMFGRATRNDVLRSYTPTMAERIPVALQGFLGRLGLNKYQARSFGQPIADVLGYSPVGAVAQSWDAGQAAARAPGMFGKVAGLGGGMALAALGAVPGGKALARKGEALAMDEASRMARAAEQGFDTSRPLYHATRSETPITAFEVGRESFNNYGFGGNQPVKRHATFFSDNAEFAKNYGTDPKEYVASQYLADISKYHHYRQDFKDSLDPFGPDRDLWLALEHGKLKDWQMFDGEIGDRFVKFLKDDGYDGARFVEESPFIDTEKFVGPEEATTTAIFDPANIRSKFAAFDPAKRGSANLLAGLGVGAMVAPSMFGNRGGER